jgi:RsbRD-like negative regulator of sigma factor
MLPSPGHSCQYANVFTIDQFGSASGTIVGVSHYKTGVFKMAAPLTVPIAQTALRSPEKSQPTSKESVAAILKRCKTSLIADWLTRTKRTPELNHLHLSNEQRTGHLPKLVDDLVKRLSIPNLPGKDSDASASAAALQHGKLRYQQGYSAAMLIHESRILQVTIFGTLHTHLTALDFSLLLPDVMTIADEVDSQLTQTMESFTNGAPKSAKAQLVKPKG